MPDEDDKETVKLAPARAIDQYCGILRGLRTTYVVTVPIIAALSIKQDKTFLEFLNENGIKKEEHEKSVTYTLPLKLAAKSRRVRKLKDQLNVAYFHLPRALVVSLVSAYDAYLGGLLKAIFLNKPEMVESSGREFTFKELTEFGSIEAARNYLIDKEVEGLIRESHIKQFDWLENRFGITLRKDLTSWPTFVEVTERRNLYVHTDAIISDQYLNNCRSHGISLDGLILGKPLPDLTPDYFLRAWRCLYEIGIKLGHVLWRKATGNMDASDDELMSSLYNLLDDGDYDLAAELGYFATKTLPKHATALNRRVMLINYCIALRFGGKPEKCCEVLDAEDWSGTEEMFQLAIAVLKQNFDEAAEIMKASGNNHKRLTRHNYENWPLFREFRGSEKFLTTYRELFGEEYEVPKPKSSEEDSKKKQTAEQVIANIILGSSTKPNQTEPNPPIGNPDVKKD